MREQRDIERDVASADPTLSPRANELLTGELQEALGTDRVTVPADTPVEEVLGHAGRPDFGARGATASVTPALVLIGGVLLVTGVIVSLATGSLWALVAAAGAHACVTVLVIAWALRRTTLVEHMDPETAARLEREGVTDPDAVLNTLVDELSGAQARERHAVTPSAGRSAPVDDDAGSAPVVFEWVILGLVAGSSIVIAVVVGGSGWLVPLVAVPLSLAWFFGQRALQRDNREGSTPRERARLRRAAPRLALLLSAGVAVAVAAFVLVFALVLEGI